ncbi:chalcone isomerase family protein [Acidovorax soli]|uniref:chalcone isomerase family protein n=1 Tax=Acidovorax soli TaxID=592050 RepID=UPI0032B151D2
MRATGKGRLTFFGLQVYDVVLWTPPGFRASAVDAQPFVLDLQYAREFSAADIARRSLDEMRRHGPIDAATAQGWQSRLATLLPDVKRGDRIAGLHRPGQGATFFHNGRPLGDIADPAFARLFFSIWLGEATSEPVLRQQLLTGATP